jgi:AAA15 family ATPase/GTPase
MSDIMLKSLKIKNFRCFEEFELLQLGRVNLIVGKNNSGKTSILEAINILNSPNNPKPFIDVIERRGEYYWSEKDGNREIFEVSHFFHGHKMENESEFKIVGDIDGGKVDFSFRLTNNTLQQFIDNSAREGKQFKFFNYDASQYLGKSSVLEWKGFDNSIFSFLLPLNIQINQIQHILQQEPKSNPMVSLVSSNVNVVIAQFNQIVLTSAEEILYESLRFIEPGVERIAPVATQGYRGNGNGGFIVLVNKQRVPIGSMGYGIWRMLEITLAMVNVPGGILLIDEIDTGLHFSVMIDLWKLILATAKKLDIQVFATTHNSDCWKSLAEVAESENVPNGDITIQRIEKGRKKSVAFNGKEMAIAAQSDIEVR